MVHRIVAHARKWMVLILLLPILTGGLAFVFAKGEKSYSATATIQLGNFENDRFTNPKSIEDQLRKTSFLKRVQEKYKAYEAADINAGMQVAVSLSNNVTISFVSSDEDKTEKTLQAIVTAFLSEGAEVFKAKQKLLQSTVSEMEKTKSVYENITKLATLHDRKMDLINLRNTEILADVTVGSATGSPKKKAVLGLVAGLILDMMIIFAPEMFRKEE